MRMHSPIPLPKNTLSGAVCAQWVRCGRPNCRCRNGQLHGPYFYRFWRHDGRLRKVYVKRAEVESVRQRCRDYRQPRREHNAWFAEWRQLSEQIREVEQR